MSARIRCRLLGHRRGRTRWWTGIGWSSWKPFCKRCGEDL